MHVLLIAPAIEDYCIEYANAVSKTARVTLVAPKRYFGPYSHFVHDSVDFRLLDWPRHRSLGNAVFLKRIVELINAVGPDIVHFLSEGVTWLGLIGPLLRRRPLITTMHDVTYHSGDGGSARVPRWFANRLLHSSARVIVHGKELYKDAEKAYPHLKGRLEDLPHVQLRRYSDIAKAGGFMRREDPTVNVLFFGRIYAYKGLNVLVRSIPRIAARFPNFRIIIAGEGEDLAPYTREITDQTYVEIRNHRISDGDTAQLFMDADIVALPYLSGSQSGVLAIANSFGKPCVVTSVGELGHSVRDGETGYVVPPGDDVALADAIIKLAKDDSLRIHFGRAALALSDITSSPDVIACRATQIYAAVLGQDGSTLSRVVGCLQ